jgi:hypothetical protein
MMDVNLRTPGQSLGRLKFCRKLDALSPASYKIAEPLRLPENPITKRKIENCL